jgi:hypothetical protein
VTVIDRSRIASWHEVVEMDDANRGERIATEYEDHESPLWKECIDALLRLYSSSFAEKDIDVVSPSPLVVRAVLEFLSAIRKQFPYTPPSLINPEPAGGIIVEWITTNQDGTESSDDLTFYNDGSLEYTRYEGGRVMELTSLPSWIRD